MAGLKGWVLEHKADISMEVILTELFEDHDMVMQVDCASKDVDYTVIGWFIFPKRSLLKYRGDRPA